MTMLRLQYVHRFKDRHGKLRHYFRRGYEKRIPLPGLPGSVEFMEAYQAALAGEGEKPASVKAPAPGSISALVEAYYRSADFRQLRDSTKTTYRGIIERFRAEHGDKPVRLLGADHIRRILEKKLDTPAAANRLLKLLHLLMRKAIEDGMRTDDPTLAVRKIKQSSEGFATWTDAEITGYEAQHPIGSRERLAFALLLYTGARRSDVVKLGWQNVQRRQDGDWLVFRQQKTKGEVSIPIYLLPDFMAVLAATPKTNLTFLINRFGSPFTAAGFGNWFRETCDETGVPAGRSAHGLRKACARRLAEAGCTPHQIAAITGHTSLSEVERYTRAANREAMANSAISLLRGKK
jgi:integrase